MPASRAWIQINVEPTNQKAESRLFDTFSSLVGELQAARAVGHCFFIRKPPGLRLRFLPRAGIDRRALVSRLIRRLRAVPGGVRRLFCSRYEPEVYQFGGPALMEEVHGHFSADTQLWVRHRDLAARGVQHIDGAVLCLAIANDLLLRCLEGAAEEAWDVWSNLARLHGFDDVDRGQATLPVVRPGDLVGAADRAERAILKGYERANERLARQMIRLHSRGRLLYGAREVLPWIIIFHWNRHWLGMDQRRRLCAAMIAALNPKRALRRALPQINNDDSAPVVSSGVWPMP
jgi:thiopeptide-type bacteriocin biosynthesis protein